MINDNTYRQFEDYLNGEMSQDKSQRFEAQLQADAAVKDAFENYSSANKLAILGSFQDIHQTMQQDFASGLADRAIRKRRTRKGLTIGAIVVAVSSLSFFLTTSKQTETHKDHSRPAKKEINKSNESSPAPSQGESESSEGPSADISATTLVPQKTMPGKSEAEPKAQRVSSPDSLTRSTTEPVAKEEQQNNTSTPPEIPCPSVIGIDLQIAIDPACGDSDDAEVLIRNHESKHKYTLIAQSGQSYTAKKGLFQGLGTGRYSLKITDQNECSEIQSSQLSIDSKDCSMGNESTVHDFSFRPEYNEVFEIPVKPNENATLTISSKNGDSLFEMEIENGYPSTWDGMELNYQTGTYLYILKFDNGTVKSGMLMIY